MKAISMIILRIDDVGRLAGDPPEQGSDGNLEYFSEWRKQCGLEDGTKAGLPAVYGVVPAWITLKGSDWLDENISLPSRVAVHGLNHRRGEVVGIGDMKSSLVGFGSDSYIAPFNEYTGNTILDWEKAGGKYFFGGFNGEHHSYAPRPKRVGSVIHLSAAVNLYGRADDIIKNFPNVPLSYPRVMTLHVPWETQPSHVARLIDKVRDQLVPLEAISEWLQGVEKVT